MGINNLNELIKRYAPDAFIKVPIDQFAGKRIAIDAANLMFTHMAIARKKVVNRTDLAMGPPDILAIRKEWSNSIVNFILSWVNNGVTPVFVRDGIHPNAKTATRQKRREVREKQKAKIDALYEKLNQTTDLLQTPGALLEELRKELRNYNFIPDEDYELFYSLIAGIGIPCLKADGDGEKLCSMLCIEGKVAAVFSVDTDNLVYGCPLVINHFSDTYSYNAEGQRIQQLDCVRFDRIIQRMDISHNVFVDLCIMSGCDYNENMPGIAGHKSLNLLRKYGNIDKLPDNYKIDCLNHYECRKLFAYEPSEKITIASETPYSLDINKGSLSTIRDFMEQAGVGSKITSLAAVYNNYKPSSDGHIEALKLEVFRYLVPKPVLNIQLPPKSPMITAEDKVKKEPPKIVLNFLKKPPPKLILNIKV